MKKLRYLFIFITFISFFTSINIFAAGKKDSKTSVTIGVLSGPSGIPAAYLMQNLQELDGKSINYQIFAAANQLLPKLLNGEIDIGFLPPNVAAKVFTANNEAIVNICTAGNGMLSLITTDTNIKSLNDLKGKKIAVAGAGATPEYLFRYILQKNDLEIGKGQDKVELDFSIPNAQIAQAVISGQISYAVVPEPFSTVATMQSSSVMRTIDLQEEFEKLTGIENYPMTLIVARCDFAKQNSSFIAKFQKKYNEAQNWTKENPKEAGLYAEKAGLGLKAQIVEKSIPSANYVYELPKDSKKRIETLLSIFLDFAPESIGGHLPSDNFYYSVK